MEQKKCKSGQLAIYVNRSHPQASKDRYFPLLDALGPLERQNHFYAAFEREDGEERSYGVGL